MIILKKNEAQSTLEQFWNLLENYSEMTEKFFANSFFSYFVLR